jgi:phytoene dehydrogenase-like protein
LENIFDLKGGNIFHGSMNLDQLYFNRPKHLSPIKNLYLCGAGAHPGGGVIGIFYFNFIGASGKNCAGVVISDSPSRLKKFFSKK